MSERPEPKQVSRRNALAFFGYAAVFGLVATPTILTVSQAEAQTTTAPATPTTPPTDAPKSGTERRQERRSFGFGIIPGWAAGHFSSKNI